MIKEMYKGMVNSPQTGISQDINESVTDIPVENGSVFPKGPNLAVIGTDQYAETIRYASVNSNILVGCTRGFQGIAKSWDSGTSIARYITEYDISSLQDNFKGLDKSKADKKEIPKKVSELENDNEYITLEEVPETDISGKVDKVIGKGLSTNDFTNEYKSEVDKVKNKADKSYVDDRVKTPVPRNAKFTDTIVDISSKVDKVNGKNLSTNDYTNADKAKVDAIPENPKYTDTIVDIVNDLTTGGIDKALSAEQGKILNNKINDIGIDESQVISLAGQVLYNELFFLKDKDLYKRLNLAYNLGLSTNIQKLTDLTSSSTAMSAVARSSAAMNAIANSSTAMNAIANSSTAMNVVTSACDDSGWIFGENTIIMEGDYLVTKIETKHRDSSSNYIADKDGRNRTAYHPSATLKTIVKDNNYRFKNGIMLRAEGSSFMGIRIRYLKLN